jgi:Sulfotransferase domain
LAGKISRGLVLAVPDSAVKEWIEGDECLPEARGPDFVRYYPPSPRGDQGLSPGCRAHPISAIEQNVNQYIPRANLFVVGAQKAGTTALSHFLAQHPAVCLAIGKEAHYFDAPDFPAATLRDTGHREYLESSFGHWTGQSFLCDATPIYLYLPECLPRISEYNKDARIIVLLRDPVERAYSHYRMMRVRGIESRGFLMALLLEPLRLWHARRDRSFESAIRSFSYLARGRYAEQLARVSAFFPPEQILVLEDRLMRTQHEESLSMVWRFLGLPSIEVRAETVFSLDDGSRPGFVERGVAKLMLFLAARLPLYAI